MKTLDDIVQALKPYGYDYLESITGVAGPGNMVVVFWTAGDCLTACVSHDAKVIWVLSCGGTGEGYTDDANEVHRLSRELFVPSPQS